MLKETAIQKINGLRKGQIVRVVYKSVKVVNGKTYEKITNTLVRFVKYANIKGVTVQNKPNQNEAKLNECEFIIENSKTGSTLVQMATTNIKGFKPSVTYICNGELLTKEAFNTEVKHKENTEPLKVFRVKLENLLAIGC